jgi:tRNA(Ile)-lysidine synthetase-like protein
MAGEELRLRDLPIGEKVNFSQSFVSMRLRSIEKEGEVVYNDTTWFFPSSVLEHAVIRTRRTGDTICRAGSTCTKELRRFMNEVHIPPRFRDRLLLVAEGKETLWLPAFGHSAGFTDAKSEAKYRETNSGNESAEDSKLYALEFFGGDV